MRESEEPIILLVKPRFLVQNRASFCIDFHLTILVVSDESQGRSCIANNSSNHNCNCN
nr:MAG TPA: hypothetical protein [Crassvirales sp.]